MDLDPINVIRKKYKSFSKGQKKLADFILSNYEKVAFMTALQLGKSVGVSESTVVRFADALGFNGYPDFQAAMAEVIQEKISSINRIDVLNDDLSCKMVIKNVLEKDAQKIADTLAGLDESAFEMAVEKIHSARHIYVVGIRNCAPLASFLSYYLKMMFDNVTLIESSNSSELFEQMLHVCSLDVVIGISFPRYSMRTLKAMEFANDRNATVISITDDKHSPMNMYSSCNLLARSDMASVVDSLVAPMSLINALIVSLCLKKSHEIANHLEELDKIWNYYAYGDNDEINMLDEDVLSDLRKLDE